MDGWMGDRTGKWMDGWMDGLYGIAYISQYMRQTRRLLPFPPRLISAGVFCVFLAEVQEDFVVGEERGLGGFDLVDALVNCRRANAEIDSLLF